MPQSLAALGQTYLAMNMRNEAVAVYREATTRVEEVHAELDDLGAG